MADIDLTKAFPSPLLVLTVLWYHPLGDFRRRPQHLGQIVALPSADSSIEDGHFAGGMYARDQGSVSANQCS